MATEVQLRRQNHLCSNFGAWSHCCVCDGRIHKEECTSRKDKQKDCCKARHKMLYESGILFGLSDSSQPMYDPITGDW